MKRPEGPRVWLVLGWTALTGCAPASPASDPEDASTTGEQTGEASSRPAPSDTGSTTEEPTDDGSTGTTMASSDGSEASTGDPPEPEDAPVDGSCASETGISDAFIDCIEGFEPRGQADFGHAHLPEIVLGPPRGGGPSQGSSHVASLGCGGRITVFFDGEGIVDRPGPDFIVFENPFVQGDETFSEPAVVLVSEDGVEWTAFDCETDQGWPPRGCAGIEPVLASGADHGPSPTDPAVAGGDAFDLAEVGVARARYVRLIDRTVEYHGDRTWCGAAGGFDLDAIAIVESAP